MVNITQIITLYENGDVKKADDLLEIAIEDNNIDFGTLYLMGIVKFELGETYLAIDYLKKALERDLGNDGCMCNIAAMYQQLNKLDHSLDYYNMALKVNPKNRIALANKDKYGNLLDSAKTAYTAETEDASLKVQFPSYQVILNAFGGIIKNTNATSTLTTTTE